MHLVKCLTADIASQTAILVSSNKQGEISNALIIQSPDSLAITVSLRRVKCRIDLASIMIFVPFSNIGDKASRP